MAGAAYQERYCAFLDIMGFGDLINEDASPIRLHSLLKKIHEPQSWSPDSIRLSNFRAQSISDAVALSTDATQNGLTHLFLTVEVLALDLLSTGYFIRGAIVKGDLYHDDKMVFGPALVHAYNLERAVVDYPRIMLPYNLFKDAQAIWGMQYKEYMRQANDGPFFIHVLRRLDARAMRGSW